MKKLLLFLSVLLLGTPLFSQQQYFNTGEELRAYVDQSTKELLVNSGEKVLDSILSYGETDNERHLVSKRLFEYDQEARQTRWTLFYFAADDPVNPTSGYQLTNEYFGNEEYETAYIYENNEWNLLDKLTFYYLDDGTRAGRLTQGWDETEMAFVNASKDTFFYFNNFTQPDSILYFNWDTATSAWERAIATRNVYDGAGLQTNSIGYTWTPSSQTWRVSGLTKLEYDLLDQVILNEYSIWDVLINDFALYRSNYYFYNGDDLLDSSSYGYFLTFPEPAKGKTYYTNENGVAIADTVYEWSAVDNLYHPTRYYTSAYDADSDLLERERFNYSTSMGEYQFANHWDYYYSELGVATEELVERGQNCTFVNPYFSGAPLSCTWTENRPTTFKVYNLQGKLQYQKVLNPQEMVQTFSINKDLPAGMYLVIWEGQRQILEQQKLIIP